MLTKQQLQQLMITCGYATTEFDSQSMPDTQQQTEKELIHSFNALFMRDGAAMNFVAAGAYDFYRPAVLDSITPASPVLSSIDNSCSVTDVSNIKTNLESKLATLTGMENVKILGEGLVQALCDMILELRNANDQTSSGKVSVLLPATLPPQLRLALRTLLKFHSIETVVIGFDTGSGRVSVSQPESLALEGVLAVLLPYINFFGVLEDVAEMAAWARQNGIKTCVIADPLVMAYLKPPAQYCDSIDYLFADLQPLGLALCKKGIGATLRAGSAEDSQQEFESYTALQSMQQDLITIQTFLKYYTAEQLQLIYLQSHKNLVLLLEQLLQIPGIRLKFDAPHLNECVLELDGIDVSRVLQILSGHNILAGYALEDEYPELSNCLMLHCTDQHDESQIERFVQKMATVIKNLSTAACPVKPKFS